MAVPSAPRLRRTAQNTQLTYELSRRVNDVRTYPVQSPQGATILIYGHDEGLTFVWRGGRRFKTTKATSTQQSKQNGSSDDAVMIIDSDEDDVPAKGKGDDKPEFEDEIEVGPFPEIVQSLDLAFPSPVLHVAAMPMSSCASDEAAWQGATVLTEKIVVAVACADRENFVMTLPLTPPSSESKTQAKSSAFKADKGTWGETLLSLGRCTKASDGIAITVAKGKGSQAAQKSARAIVAVHSREASGILRLWEIPLDTKTKRNAIMEPFQTEYLPNPLSGISFNPTHTTQLLAIAPSDGVRIYDYALPSLPDPEDNGLYPSQGSWLLTLYQPFSRPSSSRKPILDAAWIAHGRAIFALLADGMWGIWDVDGSSPSASGSSMSNKLKPGVRGAAITEFSVSGYVEGANSLRNNTGHVRENSNSGEFAPMTPHTRRQATTSLISSSMTDRLATIKGGLSVFGLPPTGSSQPDESVALWVGSQEHVAVITGVYRFWETQLRKGAGSGVNLFSGAQPTRMIKLLELSMGLMGERCCGVDLLLNAEAEQGDGGLPVDVVVQGETRFVVVRSADNGTDLRSGPLTSKRRLFSKGERSNAIIVHGNTNRSGSQTYNLSTTPHGTLRKKSLNLDDSVENDDNTTGALMLPSRSRSRIGFGFADDLDTAADASADVSSRNVGNEMLDIMDIDKALESLDSSRGPARKKVFFEED
ncbi:nucleoporin NUP37 [Sarocladium implicatum]|nr:nucleoporin NUP37 [Sarocladium implicatum]